MAVNENEAVEAEANTTDESKETEEVTNTTEAESDGTDWKAEARKWEARSKENKEKADTAEQLTAQTAELSTKVSELEAELKAANDKVANSDLVVTRFRVAAKYGVSEEDTELFLTASDEETLIKQAERLSQSTARAPKPDAAQGNRSAQATGLSPKQQGAAALSSLFE